MKNKKKGFTLVELLVVIAILAILATVSVVGYLAFTEKAKESNDISLTTQMNTVLQANEAQNKAETMSDVVSQLDEAGLGIEKLTPTSSGYSFVWDKETNRIFLLDEEKKVVSPEGASLSDNTENIMAIVHDGDELNTWTEANYGVYLASGFPTTELPDSLKKAVSFDAGELTLDEITISFSDDKDIYIAGNYDTLTISAASAGVDFYGDATFVNATVANESLHVYGHIAQLDMLQGRVVAMTNGIIDTVDTVSASASVFVGVQGGTINAVIYSDNNSNTATIDSSLNDVKVEYNESTNGLFAGGVGTETSPYLINMASQLNAIKKNTSRNKIFYKLLNDLTISSDYVYAHDYGEYYVYTVIDIFANSVLDGNNHTIKLEKEDAFFFNYFIEDATLKNITIELNNSIVANNAYNDFYFKNVTTIGELEVSNNIGSFVIYAYGNGYFDDCVSYVNMYGGGSSTNYNAVFVGYALTSSTIGLNLEFNNCSNNGNLVCGKASMFLGNVPRPTDASVKIIVNNCSNNGIIQSTYSADTWPYNHFISSNGNASKNVLIFNGKEYSGSEILDVTMDTSNEGAFILGPTDSTLKLTLNPDKTFNISESSLQGVSYYEVTISLYSTMVAGGTNVVSVTERIVAGQSNMITTLKNLQFVDLTYLKQFNDNQYSIENLPENSSFGSINKLVVINDVTYYLMDVNGCTLNGNVMDGQVISVSAYNSDGKLLSSASLTSR